MKTLQHITKALSVLMLIAAIASCSKESEKGDTGLAGTPGATGTQGIAGTDGKTILSSTVAPTTSQGANGDFYLNLSNSLLYGPKTAQGWGNGVSLKGATGAAGANGAAGSKILSGAGAPAANTGATGDFYLDKNSSSLYGPKISTGWGVATSLKGATGTANVMYSGWSYAVKFNDTTVDNSNLKVGHLIAPMLTSEVLNSATVQVYFNYGGGVFPLPYSSFAGGKLNTISYMPKFKQFIITRFTADNSNSVALSTLLQYRYVIIPGGVALATKKKVDINNYEEVKKYYNIPD